MRKLSVQNEGIFIAVFPPCACNQILIKPPRPPGTTALNDKFSTDNASHWEYGRKCKRMLFEVF